MNLLLVDDATATGRWMFDGVGQTIYGRILIYDPATLAAAKGQRRAVALLLLMSEADTNKDGTIDARDDARLLAYRFSDRTRHELLKGSFSLASMRQRDDGKILVMYEEGAKTILSSYGDDFRLLATSELPRLSTGGAK